LTPRTRGANPERFTVVISANPPDGRVIRYDDAILARAVRNAIGDFDRLQT
jgi:hypothetical protein